MPASTYASGAPTSAAASAERQDRDVGLGTEHRHDAAPMATWAIAIGTATMIEPTTTRQKTIRDRASACRAS